MQRFFIRRNGLQAGEVNTDGDDARGRRHAGDHQYGERAFILFGSSRFDLRPRQRSSSSAARDRGLRRHPMQSEAASTKATRPAAEPRATQRRRARSEGVAARAEIAEAASSDHAFNKDRSTARWPDQFSLRQASGRKAASNMTTDYRERKNDPDGECRRGRGLMQRRGQAALATAAEFAGAPSWVRALSVLVSSASVASRSATASLWPSCLAQAFKVP